LGTLAVVISLFFVVHSINRNTAVMQVTNENFLYELTDASLISVVSDPGLSSIYVKSGENVELSEIEKRRIEAQFTRFMNRWNLAFDRYQDGMFAPDKWHVWNASYESSVDKQYLREQWADWKIGWGDEFVAHVESVVFGK